MTRAQHLYYRLKKAFALYPGVLRPTSAGFLDEHYRTRRAQRSPVRAALDAVAGGVFHLWVPYRARSIARKYGLGRDWARKAARIAHRRFADPNDIALFRVESEADLDGYIRRFEHAEISKRINPKNWSAGCLLADKRLFYARCAELGLPHPPLLATLVDGAVAVREAPTVAALALKPVDGEGGSGFQLFDYPAADGDAAAFARFVRERFGRLRGAWLIQPKVTVHPDLKDLSLSALSTARVSTMLNERGEPEIVTSVLRFPSDPASQVDNIKSGGLMAPIDLATGVLGPACRGRWVGDVAEHPASGATIAGRRLPFWEEAKALVLKAHRGGFADYNLVGWDVALTAEGPLLIEGNGKPCMIVAQRAGRKGVGHQRFGELIAHHLKNPPRPRAPRA
jgi:hypothetical protein